MAKSDEAGIFSELISIGLYKRNQGRLTRQLTAGTVVVVSIVGAYIMSRGPLMEAPQWARTVVPTMFAAVLSWLAFRAVNYPKFAEFLINVEGEMARVSWPGRTELIRATTVVIGSMVFLTVVLFVFDAFWAWLLTSSGFVL